MHPRPKRRAPWPVEFYRSAVGKKWVMALTGIMLMGFVFVHAFGNLKVYFGAEDFNHYGEFLREIARAAPAPHLVPLDPAPRPHRSPSCSTSTPPTASPG